LLEEHSIGAESLKQAMHGEVALKKSHELHNEVALNSISLGRGSHANDRITWHVSVA
jgi:hypothetical protein